MNLNEMFEDKETIIFKVTNFFESEKIENWDVEKTNFKLIPEPNDNQWDAFFLVKSYIIHADNIDPCFIEVCIPERISEFVFRSINNKFTIENIIDKGFEVVPSVASDCFGDYELYYVKSNPQIGIDILKKGLALSTVKNVIAEDLGYILRDEERYPEAIEAFKISEEFGPSSEYTYRELAYAYEELGEMDKAAEYKQKFKDNGGKEFAVDMEADDDLP